MALMKTHIIRILINVDDARVRRRVCTWFEPSTAER